MEEELVLKMWVHYFHFTFIKYYEIHFHRIFFSYTYIPKITFFSYIRTSIKLIFKSSDKAWYDIHEDNNKCD